MNITSRKNDIDSCRFCFMCRHVCSCARVDRSEALTPRSRGLILSYVLRESLEYGQNIEDAIYKCCMCGYCKNWCEGNWDPPEFLLLARQDMVEKGLAPLFAETIRNNIIENGCVYGRRVDAGLTRELPETASIFLVRSADGGNTSNNAFRQVVEILEKSGESFTFNVNMPLGFSQLYLLGYRREAAEMAGRLVEAAMAAKAQKVVMMSAIDLYVLERICRENCISMEFEMVHVTALLNELIDSGMLQFTAMDAAIATFHDNDYMCRYLKLVKMPRRIIGKIPGMKIKEMPWCEDKARTTGGLLFSAMYPELSAAMLSGRMKEVLETGADMLITGDTEDRILFERYIQDGQNVKIIDLIELIYGNIK